MKVTDKLIFLFVFFICCSVLFRNLDALTIRMWDESRNAVNALEMVESGNPVVIKYGGEPDLWNTKPPLLIWCIALSMKIFGYNEFAVRFPSVVAVIVIMLSLFWLVRSNLSDIIAGVFGMLVLVTLPGFIHYHIARNGDFDAMLSMWVFLAAIFYFKWLHGDKEENKYIYWSALAIAGGMLTKGVATLILVPGLLLYSLVSGRFMKVLTARSVYVSILLAVAPIALYYVVRDAMMPGYFKAVLSNEMTGRYLEVNESHQEPFWFYFQSLADSRMGAWIYILPVFLVLGGLFGRGKLSGNLILFGIMNAIVFLLVLSSAKTKLLWYDAPVFSFLALICASGFHILNDILKKYVSLFRKYVLVNMLLTMMIVAYPVYYIHAKTSVKSRFENTYFDLFYGDMIKAYFKSHPKESLTVVHDEYNAHVLFYVKSYRLKNYDISVKSTDSEFLTGEVILTCESEIYEKLKERYFLESLYKNEDRIISVVVHAVNSFEANDRARIRKMVNDKINEIENNVEWKSSIEAKAKQNGLSAEKQIYFDAVFVLKESGQLTEDEVRMLGK